MNKKLYVIIMAAGSGSRIGSKISKSFIKINNKPLLWYSAYLFNKLDFVYKIYIIISKNDIDLFNNIKIKYFKNINKFADIIIGGDERYLSVYNALDFLKNYKDCNYIAIHDAARPVIKPEIIKDAWENTLKYDASAPGIPIIDTVKEINLDKIIKNHLKRDNLIAIQTPQIFKFEKILNSYQKVIDDKIKITDDTEAYSLLYDNIKIVNGSLDLFKITYKNDLKLAKFLIKKYKKIWN